MISVHRFNLVGPLRVGHILVAPILIVSRYPLFPQVPSLLSLLRACGELQSCLSLLSNNRRHNETHQSLNLRNIILDKYLPNTNTNSENLNINPSDFKTYKKNDRKDLNNDQEKA